MNSKTNGQTVRFGRKSLEESIRDNIRTILLTSRGEVPFRPRFGLGAERLLGGGMKEIDIAFEVADQLSMYEKRIKVNQVVSNDLGEGRRQVMINYTIKETDTRELLIIG